MRMYELSRFSLPTEIIFGFNSTDQLGLECKRLGATRVLVVTDTGVAPILGGALASLESYGIPYVVFDQAPRDPTAQAIGRSVTFLKEHGCDFVVTAGGGSALCTGKGTAFMARNEGSICDYRARDKRRIPPLPCIAIPTTAGSGSEVSKITPITDDSTNIKYGIFGDPPRVAILDPLLLKSLPRGQAIASSVDALTHSIEAFTSRYATPLTDGIALTAMEMIARNFCPSILGDDLDAKGEMLFASSVANIACGNAGLGLSHAINGALTWLYKMRGYTPVSYGDLHAIFLPLVIEFNLPAAEAKFARMAKAFGVGEEDDQGALATKGVERIKELLTSVNACCKLPWQRIPENDLEEVAKKTLNTAQADQNPRKASESEIVSLIQKTMGAS